MNSLHVLGPSLARVFIHTWIYTRPGRVEQEERDRKKRRREPALALGLGAQICTAIAGEPFETESKST